MSKKPTGEDFTEEELVDEQELCELLGVSSEALSKRIQRGGVPRPICRRPRRWLRAEVFNCLPEAHLVDDEVETITRELAEPIPRDVQGRFTPRGPVFSKEVIQPAEQARLEVCLIARALADQAALLVAVRAADTPAEVPDEKHLVEAIQQVSRIVENLQNMAVAYLDKQEWDHAKIAQALGQSQTAVQRRLTASRRTPLAPRLEPPQLDHWLSRYWALRGPERPTEEKPSAGLRRIGINAKIRRMNRQASALDADPRSSAKEREGLHRRRADLYRELLRSTEKKEKPAVHESLLKEAKRADEAAEEAHKDHRHVRPSAADQAEGPA
ncbi:hypothetical protein AB0J28_20375 [Streptosporangium canum]|uniref:hypothetical protein n=1 Tax=Streptosporangium canum TaxID=324952 RepID=UPI00344135F5